MPEGLELYRQINWLINREIEEVCLLNPFMVRRYEEYARLEPLRRAVQDLN